MRSCTHPCVAAAHRQAGLSLIEVMVAVVILSLGLLGMGALMGLSVRNTQGANHQSQATNLAYEMIDMARANFGNRALYHTGAYTAFATACAADEAPIDLTACGTAVACDKARWAADLCNRLPNGRGRVDISQIGVGTGAYQIQVDICWTDNRGVVINTAANCGDGDNDGIVDDLEAGSENKLRVISGL